MPIDYRNKRLLKGTRELKWTRQAALCYYIGSSCSRCDIPKDMISRCKMRETVIELVTVNGKPPEKFIEKIQRELAGEKIPADSYIIEDDNP